MRSAQRSVKARRRMISAGRLAREERVTGSRTKWHQPDLFNRSPFRFALLGVFLYAVSASNNFEIGLPEGWVPMIGRALLLWAVAMVTAAIPSAAQTAAHPAPAPAAADVAVSP